MTQEWLLYLDMWHAALSRTLEDLIAVGPGSLLSERHSQTHRTHKACNAIYLHVKDVFIQLMPS